MFMQVDPLYLEYALALILWGGSEVFVSVRKRNTSPDANPVTPRYLWVLWMLALGSIGVAIAAAFLGLPSLVAYEGLRFIGFAIMAVGMAVRWHAIQTLGRFFSVHVELHAEHRLVESGLYRYVRHPSYTGILITLLGLGIALGNALSVLLAVLPMSIAIQYRIRIEEQALTEAFGEAYTAYCKRTKRLLPWMY